MSYVFSENTSAKSLHHSGRERLEVLASWASWVDRVIFWIDLSNGSSRGRYSRGDASTLEEYCWSYRVESS